MNEGFKPYVDVIFEEIIEITKRFENDVKNAVKKQIGKKRQTTDLITEKVKKESNERREV